MKNRIQWYILGGLLFILTGVLIGRIIEGWEKDRNSEIRAAILIRKDSEQEYSELMSGIRDYARENDILIHVNYMDDSEASDLVKVLREEKELGSAGAFIVYPEEFYHPGDIQKIAAEIPVLVVSNERTGAFDNFTEVYNSKRNDKDLRYRLEESDILQLMEGQLEQLVVINEYHLGYSAVEALAKAASRKKLSNISMEYLELTAEDVSSGKYNALLSDR